MPRVDPPKDTRRLHCPGGSRHTKRKGETEKTARWMEIILVIAVTHPQGAGVWVGIWTLKSRFENSCNYSNVLTNVSKKALVFFRKALNKYQDTN